MYFLPPAELRLRRAALVQFHIGNKYASDQHTQRGIADYCDGKIRHLSVVQRRCF